MKILIQSYNTCCQNVSGGVQIRIRSYLQALRLQQVECDYFTAFGSDLKQCDILHIFKLDIENLALAQCAKALGKKVVLSSIVNCINGRRIDFYRMFSKFPVATTYRFLFHFVDLCDLIIAETQEEKDFLIAHFGANPQKICIIENGVNDYSTDDACIYDYIGAQEDYVLQVGRFDSNKNQLSTIKALKNTGIHVVFIGGAAIGGEAYYEKCVQEADGDDHIHFLGWQDNDSALFHSAFSHAKVLLMSSYSETYGLTVLEGAVCGANLVISKTLPILEDPHFHKCLTCDPSSVDDIRSKVQSAFTSPRDPQFQQAVRQDFSWEGVAKKHIKYYRDLLGE